MRPVHPDPSESRVAIGARLRNARTAQGLSLAQVATTAGLTKGFLSRLERDETSPSVATLVQLCQVLSVPVGALFAEPEIQKVALDDAPLINLGGTLVTERLVSPRSESRVQIIRSSMQPGATGGHELYTISSEVEVLHVLTGGLTAHFVDRSVPLAAGDSLTFPGREPHNWSADADTGAEVMWVIVPASWSGTA
ncbi:helix-turn-helix domain-containing protein [Agromyces aerolatus]|uniref:helix-turn-helix domain-containing protein n=1 Tax=Agromyces sp. LY-1074 TaxID=3074080 RepID=UPI0028630730|nr:MULTISPECIES: helix-turn-helix domain-containing protein [unclassified Agromyces]MDR5699645.1 helix-turn-helix domain-containing protein [Agromyces sp. LY-1074]MDR5705941.1 helix-turn-helix domain-containing protein [Agromyces sp. LY-1358]